MRAIRLQIGSLSAQCSSMIFRVVHVIVKIQHQVYEYHSYNPCLSTCVIPLGQKDHCDEPDDFWDGEGVVFANRQLIEKRIGITKVPYGSKQVVALLFSCPLVLTYQ